MTWKVLIGLLVEFFLLPWLERLLDGLWQELDGSPDHLDPPQAVARVFAGARGRLWWFQWGRRAALATLERIALRRAQEFHTAARYGWGVPYRDELEDRQIKEL